ncbi:MAG: Holliday junction resolvase RuvX [Bacteroidota bacterium]
MARILCIDYGTKKVGMAVTDPLQIIVSGLDTVSRSDLDHFLESYMDQEDVEKIVIGDPGDENDQTKKLQNEIRNYKGKLEKKYPGIPIEFQDESFSSKDAKAVILASGAKKKKRRNKSLVDKISAVLILQDHLNHR